jgi:hypothetical protein
MTSSAIALRGRLRTIVSPGPPQAGILHPTGIPIPAESRERLLNPLAVARVPSKRCGAGPLSSWLALYSALSTAAEQGLLPKINPIRIA